MRITQRRAANCRPPIILPRTASRLPHPMIVLSEQGMRFSGEAASSLARPDGLCLHRNVGEVANATVDVDHFIELDRQSIRIHFMLGLALLVVGTLGISGAFSGLFSSGVPNFESISKGVGLVINLAGLFPFNNCWSRWERIKTLRAIKLNPSAMDADALNELIRKLYAKFLGV